MSFKLFIYYCALCGGWAALLAWLFIEWTGLPATDSVILRDALIAAIVGLLLAFVIGAVDALLNAVGWQRTVRSLVCLVVGMLGGFFGGTIGAALYTSLSLPRFPGWMLVGAFIGASIGVFDLVRAWLTSQNTRAPLRKILNGIIGGVLGGLLGGVLFDLLVSDLVRRAVNLPRSSLAIGLVILGLCIGLLIGLAQVILKEAWLRVESGFRAGREVILAKAETTIGRAESCDIGLFGDKTLERLHARIIHEGDRYLLADAGTPGGTFLNGQRLAQPTPLRSGDSIGIGHSILRFGERQKRPDKLTDRVMTGQTSQHAVTIPARSSPFANP